MKIRKEELDVFVHVDWASDILDRKSISGILIKLGKNSTDPRINKL